MSCRQQLHVTWVDTFRPRITSGRETKKKKNIEKQANKQIKKDWRTRPRVTSLQKFVLAGEYFL